MPSIARTVPILDVLDEAIMPFPFEGNGPMLVEGERRTLCVAFMGSGYEVLKWSTQDHDYTAPTDGRPFAIGVDALLHAERLASMPLVEFNQACAV